MSGIEFEFTFPRKSPKKPPQKPPPQEPLYDPLQEISQAQPYRMSQEAEPETPQETEQETEHSPLRDSPQESSIGMSQESSQESSQEPLHDPLQKPTATQPHNSQESTPESPYTSLQEPPPEPPRNSAYDSMQLPPQPPQFTTYNPRPSPYDTPQPPEYAPPRNSAYDSMQLPPQPPQFTTYNPHPSPYDTPQPPPYPPYPPQNYAKKPRAARKKRRGRIAKRIIGWIIALAVVAGIAYGMYWLFTQEKEMKPLTEHISRGMLETAVQGWGNIRPVEQADIAVLHKGKVRESYYNSGDMVNEGDLLFEMDSEELDKKISDYRAQIDVVQKKIDKANENISTLLGDEAERIANLTVKAPFKGQLTDVTPLKVGDYVSTGSRVGVLVDDVNLVLSLYFSYAYEDSVTLGQAADVSVPATMSVVSGKVAQINKVRKISPEGTTLFEVVIGLQNPGALTAGMEASATIKSGIEDIYPSETGVIDFARSEVIMTKAPGKLTYAHVINYMDYEAGETICTIEYKEDNAQVEALRQEILAYKQEIDDIEENIELTMEGYSDLSVTAPLSGTIMYNNLIVGLDVEPGLAVISIAKLDKMMVDAMVDERQISQVRPGMPVQITVWMMGEMVLPGVVKSISMTPAPEYMGSGVIYYKSVFEIENYSGMLMSGQGVNYRLVVEQKFDILIAPVIAVKNTEQGTCVFVLSDLAPENAIELEKGIVPDGFYAVPVECGIGNENGIEIISGVEEGAEVFTQLIPLDQEGQGGMRGGVIMYG